MTTISPGRAETGYLLDDNEGEAFWLLGMLQTIKIGRDDTDGRYGLVEILVPPGVGSPWPGIAAGERRLPVASSNN